MLTSRFTSLRKRQAILVFSLLDFRFLSYDRYIFPMWANVVGIFISLASASMIPIVAFYKLRRESGSVLERAKRLMAPTSEWGPALAVHRREAGIPIHQDSQIPLTDACPPCKFIVALEKSKTKLQSNTTPSFVFFFVSDDFVREMDAMADLNGKGLRMTIDSGAH